MQGFFKKKVLSSFFWGGGAGVGGGRKHYALSSYLFTFLKVSSLTFLVQTMAFQINLLSQCILKVIQYAYEIFQTVLSLNSKII